MRYEPPPQLEKFDWRWRKWIFGFYKKIDVQEIWMAPTFENSWVNSGGSVNPAGYMKDSLGFVHLRGSVKTGTAGTAIFTLPAGYRPAYKEVQVTVENGAIASIDIEADGLVSNQIGGNTALSLDGITFKAA